MPENDHYKDFGVLNPETHHETSDVDVRGILWFVVIFVAFAIVTHLVLYFLFRFFTREFRADIQPARTSIRTPAQMPQTPRLQPFPQGWINAGFGAAPALALAAENTLGAVRRRWFDDDRSSRAPRR